MILNKDIEESLHGLQQGFLILAAKFKKIAEENLTYTLVK